MSAVFDGIEIWQEGRHNYPLMTKEQQEKWDKIQEHCKVIADEMIKYADTVHEEESVGC